MLGWQEDIWCQACDFAILKIFAAERTAVEPNCPGWYDDPVSSSAESIFELSPSEKLQLVEDLWDDIASTPDEVPVYDWQKEELARRKQNLLSNPGSALSWEEIQRRVRSRYGR